jgi:tetrahydromethanopterin S-methyltransferase subunit H
MLPLIKRGNFDSVFVDTSVMNLPTISLSLAANNLIKKEFGLPVGFAPSNGTYMWRKSASVENIGSFPAIDAGVHAISAMASDFLFYGPMTGTSRVFPAVAAASSMMAALAYDNRAFLPGANHPLSRMFPDIVTQFKNEGEEK